MKRHHRALLWAGLASLAGLFVGPLSVLFLPLRLLNTHIHELRHAVMAIMTGGQVAYIGVFANGSGVTPILGGNLLLTASAGYIGASFVGAAILAIAHDERSARGVLRGMGIVMTFSTAVWVRTDLVGILSGFLWAAGLLALSFVLRKDALIFAAQFVGVQLCLNAIDSVLVLYHLSASTDAQSDAMIMQQATGIPAIVWAVLWVLISGVLIFLGLRTSLRKR